LYFEALFEIVVTMRRNSLLPMLKTPENDAGGNLVLLVEVNDILTVRFGNAGEKGFSILGAGSENRATVDH
jgi:hypothetical protein